jgi:pimeloyl-ACP methyl ester carboxylesterase
MVKDVLDYCETNNLENINLLGHSMGGKVAMLFAAQNPEKVSKLIIADIGSKFYPQHHQSILEGLLAVDFATKPSRNEVDTIISKHISDFGTRQFLLKNLYWQEPSQLAFRFNLKSLVANIDEIGKALPKDLSFSKQTLFVRGGNSNYILNADFEGIKSHFPQAIFQTIPDVGHWLHAENPELFFKIVNVFLAS